VTAERLSAEDVARAMRELAEAGGDAALVPYVCPRSGRAGEIILLSDAAAESLAGLLGRFGDALTVKIFAAVTLSELDEADIATAVGGDAAEVGGQIARLAGGGFLVGEQIGGATLWAAGNPPLRRFFARRFAPDRKLHP